MAAGTRLDQALVERGMAPSREKAQALIRAGMVRLGEVAADQADQRVPPGAALTVVEPARFVGRGGDKLEGALEDLGVEVVGRVCLDAGASTGGFTDCLLQRGAVAVHAVDVGYNQLDWRLRQDPRVTVMERQDVRALEALPGPAPTLVVGDLSFISLRKVVPALVRLAASGAEMVLLVKPQFELGPGRVGKGGVVRDPADRREAVDGFLAWAAGAGLEVLGEADSRLTGAQGNQETFVHLRVPAAGGAGGGSGAIEASAPPPAVPDPTGPAAVRLDPPASRRDSDGR
ncbi:MAG TPA: TlyA family RNA methyltransferase [Candidatus Dormibacteraeota bacterium]|nr:TlyA family RNA methyltransferase [Candidatus Dormibacteraeota bacterium]